jgi:hypothetical protein
VPSFGTPILGPVIFFLGAFVEGLFDAKDRKGDNDTANSIAFGIWYGIIILVAIFGAATIGVENPFTIESIFGSGGETSYRIRREKEKIWMLTFISRVSHWLTLPQKYVVINDPVEIREQQEEEVIPFTSPYMTVWIGQRHISFRKWIKEASSFPEAKMSRFYRYLMSSWTPKILAFATAIAVVILPSVLAASISYYTPTVR